MVLGSYLLPGKIFLKSVSWFNALQFLGVLDSAPYIYELQIISEKILFTCFTLNLVQFYQIFSNIYIVQNLNTFILITPTYCPGLVSCIYVFYRL